MSVVVAGVVVVALVGAWCFRQWLTHAASMAAAERQARLEEAKAAPSELAALRKEVLDLQRRLERDSLR